MEGVPCSDTRQAQPVMAQAERRATAAHPPHQALRFYRARGASRACSQWRPRLKVPCKANLSQELRHGGACAVVSLLKLLLPLA